MLYGKAFDRCVKVLFNLNFVQGMKKKDKNVADNQSKEATQHDAREKTEKDNSVNENEQTDDTTEVENNDADIVIEKKALEEKLDSLQKEMNEANDKFLRLFSEFDNYRKRVARERIELTKTASESIILALLPVLDDLERASNMPGSEGEDNTDTGKEGIKLIFNKFKSILRQKGVEDIESMGEVFNTDYHEAITHTQAENEKQKGTIVEEVQKGYLLNGKVIRHARVVVAN
jgi:molecular chaperone GrpE